MFSTYVNTVVVCGFSCDLFNIHKSNVVKALCERLKLYIVHKSKLTHYDMANDSTSLLDYFSISDVSVITLVSHVQCPTISDQALIVADFKFVDIPLHAFTRYRNYNSIHWNGLYNYLYLFPILIFV